MNGRFFTSVAVLVIVIAALLAMPVAGQAPATSNPTTAKPTPATSAAKPSTWTPPKTAWGDPDLQGIYNYATSNSRTSSRPASEVTRDPWNATFRNPLNVN